MKGILRKQTGLSIASAAFYCAGGILSVLAITVFHEPSNPLNIPSLITAFLSFFLAAAFFFAGRRIGTSAALLLLCLSAVLVLVLVITSKYEVRAMTSGLLFYTYLIYLVWFGPMWLARLFGYLWLAAYGIAMVVKYGSEVHQYVVTMSVTVIVLGELVGLYKRRIEQVSLIDPLCGVWNKRGFEIMLRRAERITRRGGQPLSLIFLDLDDFKGVNDGGGHAEGDRVLREFAAGIEGATRPQDTLGRLGGDEFALLLVGVDAEEAERLGRRLRDEVRVAEWSFGVAELRPGESLADLVTRADGSMFSEKRDRKGRSTATEGRIDP